MATNTPASPYWERRDDLSPSEQLEEAARYWDSLAAFELDRPNWDRYADSGSCKFRANTYKRTAEALRIQIQTGVAVCSCCHNPLGEGVRI